MNKLIQFEIQKYKGIEEINLDPISRINIICGKNNSGKSTILSALLEKKFKFKIPTSKIKAKIIYDIIEEEHYQIDQEYEGAPKYIASRFNGDDVTNEIYNLIKENRILEEYLKKTPFISNTDEYKFEEDILSIIQSKNIKSGKFTYDFEGKYITFEDDIFKIIFKHLVKFEGKFLYIDAKRHIESDYSLEKNTANYNLIKHLFYLRNSENKIEQAKIKKLKRAFKKISEGYDFKIKTDQNFNLSLNFRFSRSELFHADDCGLGLRDLLIILSYIILYDDSCILLIEEPESHLHPSIQRKLLDYIKRSSRKQYFISTHSSVFLDTNFVDNIYLVSYKNGKIKATDSTSKANLLTELGYSISDNLLADLVILVEGPSDKMIINEFLSKAGIFSTHNVKIWALGGSIMNQHDLSIFKNTYKVIALIDNDPSENRLNFENHCKSLQIPIIKLKRYAIENYFTIKALKNVFGNKIHVDDDFKIEPNIKLSEQAIGEFNPKRGQNPRLISREMTLNDIKNTDFFKIISKTKKMLGIT